MVEVSDDSLGSVGNKGLFVRGFVCNKGLFVKGHVCNRVNCKGLCGY